MLLRTHTYIDISIHALISVHMFCLRFEAEVAIDQDVVYSVLSAIILAMAFGEKLLFWYTLCVLGGNPDEFRFRQQQVDDYEESDELRNAIASMPRTWKAGWKRVDAFRALRPINPV